MQIAIVDEAGQERAVHKLTYGAKLHVKDGQTVKRGNKLFEWDPYTLPIIAEKAGVARFKDLISGISVREDTDDATGMTQKIVSDWRSAPRGSDLKPEIILVDPATGDPVRGDNGNPITYPMSVDAILSVEDGQELRPGDVVARIPREGAKTKDITGGLPRVAELFEARRPKDHAIIAETDGYVRFGKDYKNKRRITVEPVDETHPADGIHDPQGQAHSGSGRRLRPEGRLHHGRQPGSARHPADHGHRGAGQLHDRRSAGRLSPAGREDQRQAHRGDRAADAAEARGAGLAATRPC